MNFRAKIIWNTYFQNIRIFGFLRQKFEFLELLNFDAKIFDHL